MATESLSAQVRIEQRTGMKLRKKNPGGKEVEGLRKGISGKGKRKVRKRAWLI